MADPKQGNQDLEQKQDELPGTDFFESEAKSNQDRGLDPDRIGATFDENEPGGEKKAD